MFLNRKPSQSEFVGWHLTVILLILMSHHESRKQVSVDLQKWKKLWCCCCLTQQFQRRKYIDLQIFFEVSVSNFFGYFHACVKHKCVVLWCATGHIEFLKLKFCTDHSFCVTLTSCHDQTDDQVSLSVNLRKQQILILLSHSVKPLCFLFYCLLVWFQVSAG